MTPQNWQLMQHVVTAPHPITNAIHLWRDVPRLYVVIQDSAGRTGIGEASPLPGYSPDTVSICHTALSALLPQVMNRPIQNLSDIAIIGQLVSDATPAARFALETALLDLLAQSRHIPLWSLFIDEASPVLLNGLLTEKETDNDAQRLFNSGIRVFKLKVGAANRFSQEQDRLQRLRAAFKNAVTIRLDANGALAGPHLMQTLDRLSAFAPEYIEEPIPLHQELPERLPVAFAADESLVRIQQPEDIAAHPQCRAFVLKPTLLGGFFKVLKLAQIARQHDCEAVTTHCYESLPGFLAAIHLAIAINAKTACGLYPHDVLNTPSPEKYFRLSCGHISLTSQPGLGIQLNDIAQPATTGRQ